MKLPSLLAVITALVTLPFVAAKPTQSGASKLTVNFPGWEKYTDIKDEFSPTDQGQLAILDDLHRAMESNAGYLVPDGDHLTITFSDIDLAGDFEPGRGPNFDDIRIVKSIYPPRFAFTYSLTDSSGREIKSGKENLVDMNFDWHVSLDTSDARHYEKDALRAWMERKLHKL
jgi:hypothetical protein